MSYLPYEGRPFSKPGEFMSRITRYIDPAGTENRFEARAKMRHFYGEDGGLSADIKGKWCRIPIARWRRFGSFIAEMGPEPFSLH